MNEALLVVDLQKDFCSGGALAVPDADAVIPLANQLMAQSSVCVITADWHPQSHASFAVNNVPGSRPGDEGQVGDIWQTLWPVHCVQGSDGAAFHPLLETDHADLILRKGYRRLLDSYSAFFENDRRTCTGLDGYLRARGVEAVAIIGLALDYCVAWSAEDACRLGYATRVILPACRAMQSGRALEQELEALQRAGVQLVQQMP